MTAGIGVGLEPPLSPPVVRGHSGSVPMLSSANISDLPTSPPAIRLPESVAPAPEPQQPEQAPAAESDLPVMAPAEGPLIDYFSPPEPAAETMAPLQPAVEIAPAAFFAPQPVEAEVQVEPEVAPESIVAREPELRLPDDPFEAALPAPEPVSTPELDELFAPKRSGQFRVVVRLREGEGVEVGEFREFGTAMEGAQEVIEQFSSAAEGQWPFYAGRFIRPDLIVSVDVVEGEQAG